MFRQLTSQSSLCRGLRSSFLSILGGRQRLLCQVSGQAMGQVKVKITTLIHHANGHANGHANATASAIVSSRLMSRRLMPSRLMSSRLMHNQSEISFTMKEANWKEVINQLFASGRRDGLLITERLSINNAETLFNSGYQNIPFFLIVKLLDKHPNIESLIERGIKRLESEQSREERENDPLSYEYGVIDSLVTGNFESLENLLSLCHTNTLDPLLIDAKEEHILMCSSEASKEEVVRTLSTNPEHWLYQPNVPNAYKVLFINGRKDSKEWVLRGGESENQSESNVWKALVAANVSILYKETFGQDWVHETTKSQKEISKSLEELSKFQEELSKSLEEISKSLEEQIKSVEEQIKSVEEQIKSVEELRKSQEEQIKSVEEQIKSQEEQIKSVEEQIKSQEELRKSQEEQIKSQEEQIKKDAQS